MKISNSNVANTVHKRVARNNILLFSALLAGAVLSGCGGGGGGSGGSGASDVPVQQTKAIVSQPGSEGYALNSAEIGRLYGPGVFRQDALGNTMIGINGSQERIVSNRFRATISGNLASARLYWQPGTGYSRGNGGVIRLRLLPDDGSDAHAPDMSATPLATAEFTPGSAAQGDRAIFADSTFTSQRPLVAGQIYHLVMDNVAPDPRENYISSNNAITHEQNDRPSRWVSSIDWGTLRGSRAAGSSDAFTWSDYTRNASNGNYYVPILQLTTADGQRQGMANMESGAVDPGRIFTIGAEQPIRERFRPTRERRVTGLSFATAASVAGTLQWRILQGSNVLASGQFTTDAPNYTALQANANRVGKVFWHDAEINGGQGVTLAAGQTYDVEFQPQGQSQWKVADFYNGSLHGFSWPAAFTESNAQHRVNGQWINVDHFNHARAGKIEANWPVVLHMAP